VRGHYRHTKIIATVGPATETPEKLAELIRAGVDVIRLNMAHGSGDWVINLVKRIREVSAEVQRSVAVMMDIKGPEIRTAAITEAFDLTIGQTFEFHTSSPSAGVPSVGVNYPGLPRDVRVGATVLVDSGLIRMEVLETDETHVRCKVLTPGKLGSRRHINLPGVDVNLPSLTEKDEQDIAVGVDAEVDFFAMSFVRKADDVLALKNLLELLKSKARIIAKIEDQSGLRNLEGIVKASDAVMVARGDLGIEIDYFTLPIVQSRIVELCLTEGKPVSAPMPTRAEISDICNAARERADAVMLSGETTTGAYPMECVEVMKNILTTVEPTEKRKTNELIRLQDPKAYMLKSAAVLAQQIGHAGIVVFTRSGALAYTLAGLRTVGVPIYAFTDNEALFRQLLLPWGVEPFLMQFSEDPEETILNAMGYLKRQDWCAAGSWLVVITTVLASGKAIDSIQLRQVE
jgi:pyruvate kinase